VAGLGVEVRDGSALERLEEVIVLHEVQEVAEVQSSTAAQRPCLGVGPGKKHYFHIYGAARILLRRLTRRTGDCVYLCVVGFKLFFFWDFEFQEMTTTILLAARSTPAT
jgi:hypothetical protein